jgi:hypothetical protein
MRIRTGAALLAIVALTLAACSEDDSKKPASTTTSSTTTTTTTTPTTTSPPTTPPTAPPTTPTTAPPTSAEQCAQALFTAWANANQAAAPDCAPAATVQEIFSQPYNGAYTGPDCEGAAGSVYCTWTGAVKVIIQVQNMPPFTVTSVQRQAA